MYMTPQGMDFINRLSIEDRCILKSLLEQDIKDVQNYLSFILPEDNKTVTNGNYSFTATGEDKTEEDNAITLNAIDLTKDISMAYLPIMGLKPSRQFYTVYEYLDMNVFEKHKCYYKYQVEICDFAILFLLKHLDERIALCKENHRNITSGLELLNENLKEKIDLVLSQKEDIHQFLKANGENYIFVGNTRDII